MQKLADFGVKVEVTAVAPGPVITRFEIQPAPGVKASKISNLAKDLARSMAMVALLKGMVAGHTYKTTSSMMMAMIERGDGNGGDDCMAM